MQMLFITAQHLDNRQPLLYTLYDIKRIDISMTTCAYLTSDLSVWWSSQCTRVVGRWQNYSTVSLMPTTHRCRRWQLCTT